ARQIRILRFPQSRYGRRYSGLREVAGGHRRRDTETIASPLTFRLASWPMPRMPMEYCQVKRLIVVFDNRFQFSWVNPYSGDEHVRRNVECRPVNSYSGR